MDTQRGVSASTGPTWLGVPARPLETVGVGSGTLAHPAAWSCGLLPGPATLAYPLPTPTPMCPATHGRGRRRPVWRPGSAGRCHRLRGVGRGRRGAGRRGVGRRPGCARRVRRCSTTTWRPRRAPHSLSVPSGRVRVSARRRSGRGPPGGGRPTRGRVPGHAQPRTWPPARAAPPQPRSAHRSTNPGPTSPDRSRDAPLRAAARARRPVQRGPARSNHCSRRSARRWRRSPRSPPTPAPSDRWQPAPELDPPAEPLIRTYVRYYRPASDSHQKPKHMCGQLLQAGQGHWGCSAGVHPTNARSEDREIHRSEHTGVA